MDRTISFSVKPDNLEVLAQIKAIKSHCKSTGTNFSYLMCKAVTHVFKEELKLCLPKQSKQKQ